MKDSLSMSTFDLKDYKGTVYVLSMSNKHDVWMRQAEV